MNARIPKKITAAVVARLLPTMSHKIAIAGMLAGSIAAASAGNFSTYVTNVYNPNGVVVTDATSNMISYATFTNIVAQAFTTNYGGVWNMEAPSGWTLANNEVVTFTNSSGQTNLTLTHQTPGSDYVSGNTGGGGNGIATSGTLVMAGNGGSTSDPRSFIPSKPLAAVGIICVSRNDGSRLGYLTVNYLDGTTASTSNSPANAAYFHGLIATNSANPITKFTVMNNSSSPVRWDDLGFIVAPPLPVLPPDTNAAVSINFNGVDGSGVDNAQANSLAATDSAGASGYARTNWNNLDRWGDLGSGVKDKSGADSGLQIRWDAAGVGSSGSASLGTPDGKMMDGMDQTDWGGGPPAALNQNTSVYGQPASDKPMVYVTGLQAYMTAKRWTNYAVVMYVNGWHGGNGVAQHWIQSVTNANVNSMGLGGILAGPLYTKDSGPFNGTYSQVAVNSTNSASASSGNYIVFGGLTNNSILLCTGEPNNSWQAGQLMGFQIVNSALPTANIPVTSAPTISPSSTVYAGVPATLTEVATPDPNDTRLWYQWYSDNATGGAVNNPIVNATNATLNVTPTNNTTTYNIQYLVVVTNVFGASTSSVVTLTVNPAVSPYVTTDTTPGAGNGVSSVYAYVNGSVTFNANFAGTLPITNQWQADTGGGYASLTLATNTTLTLTNLQLASSGNYRLHASNPVGSADSTPAALTVLADPAAPDASQAYAYAVFTNSPYAYWRFSETIDATTGNSVQAYDYSGHNYNATYGNQAYNMQAGPSASSTPSCPGFESTNTAVTTYNNTANSWLDVPSLNLNTNTVTITAWINPSGAIGANWGLFIWRGTNGDAAGLSFGGTVSNSMAELGYKWNSNSPSANNFHSGLYPPMNQWSFVALTITPTNSSLYLYYTDGNGTYLSKAVQSITNNPEAFSGGTIRIGSDNNSGRNFNGSIDEVAVYSRSLSETQLQNLFLVGSGLLGVPAYIATDISATPTNISNLFPGQVPVQLTVVGAGAPAPGYQWQAGSGGVFTNLPNSGSFSGVNSGTLTINPVTPATYLDYQVIVTNLYGSATSSVYTVQMAIVPTDGLWTARYQLTNSTGDIGWGVYYGSGSYSGPGVLGSGNFWNPLPGGGQWNWQTYASVSDYQDNGSTHSGITCKMTGQSVSLGMGGSAYASTNRAGLLTQYLYYFGSQANAIVFTNVPNGTYNLALHGDAPTWGRGTTFTVHGANGDQTDTTVNSSQTQYLINHDSSVVITNVTVTTGVLNVDVAFATGQGPVNAAEIQLVSYAPPTAGFSATPTSAFVNQSVTFVNSASPVTNLLWNFGDGNTLNTTVNGNVSHAYSTPGTYTVSQTVKNPGGTASVTNTAYITVLASPVIGGVTMSGGSLVLSGTGGISGQQYRILTSTNLALPLASWTTVLTSTFAPDGSYGYTNSTPTNQASFYILVSP